MKTELCECVCVCARCMCRNAEKIRNENCFFNDFDVNLSYCIIRTVTVRYLFHTCEKRRKTKKRRAKKSRIATVQWMTLYTQLTVYDAINMDIQYSTPQSHKYKQNKRKARRFSFMEKTRHFFKTLFRALLMRNECVICSAQN